MPLFELLEDVDRRVRSKVGQPRDFSGQPTWEEADFENAYNKAYLDCRREIMLIDKNFSESMHTETIPAGTLAFTFPAGDRINTLRALIVVDSQGRQRRLIRTATPEEYGTRCPGVAGWFNPDRGVISFTDRLTETLTLEAYFTSWYVPLLHGCAQQGGGSSMTLAAHSSAEDDLFVGLPLWIVEGTGIGQTNLITDYVGATRVATFLNAWTTVPDNTSRYTSRPDLPWDAKDVFENMSIAALYEKTSDAANQAKFWSLAQSKLSRMASALETKELREPSYTYDQNLNGGWGDPGSDYLRGY